MLFLLFLAQSFNLPTSLSALTLTLSPSLSLSLTPPLLFFNFSTVPSAVPTPTSTWRRRPCCLTGWAAKSRSPLSLCTLSRRPRGCAPPMTRRKPRHPRMFPWRPGEGVWCHCDDASRWPAGPVWNGLKFFLPSSLMKAFTHPDMSDISDEWRRKGCIFSL